MLIKKNILIFFLFSGLVAGAQLRVDLSGFNPKGEAKANVQKEGLSINWPVGGNERGRLHINLQKGQPLFSSIQQTKKGAWKEIASNLSPSFLLTVGKRDLVSQNGWNIFFDKTNKLPSKTFTVDLEKQRAAVISQGSRTVVKISRVEAGTFNGDLEITVYNGSPLFNVAAVLATEMDSTAILYDAGLVGEKNDWNKIAWANTNDKLQSVGVGALDTSRNQAVKYRTIIGENAHGSLAVFPAPHQYFYPLDEAFNLKFTWYGPNYKKLVPGFGLGIRQDPMGDNRWVPWFNAPPGTKQRLNFFCLLSTGDAGTALTAVKRFTNGDVYRALPGYKTMSSHFHNEYVMNVLLAGKPSPDTPNFVRVFKNTGINIVHLGEFHYTAHPKGPDEKRLLELKTLFDMCRTHSDADFLLLPGEEPNEFFGGHWLEFFPKPVYWIMSRKEEAPFVSADPVYGKVYRIGNKAEMLKLLELENGLAWTAHPRTKGSTGYPDKYKEEAFFASDRFFGAAWKAMPADLSQPRLGKRVLDLMDDMANWGYQKHVLAEADLFSVEPENEMYAHLNVNYLQLDRLPKFNEGWHPVLDAMRQGKFFVTTGEILLPHFTVNGKAPGETAVPVKGGKTTIELDINWTFPLQFAEIVSGDGKAVYRERINLDNTKPFGKKKFSFQTNLVNRKWVRVEVWDAAVNGAFTQQVWLQAKTAIVKK
ncbi:CehA/McbA family metallohydrolase domain-containing protein [Flavisolibacter nicotianae]|uniref:hypothetical protein n=1 Tax=Flavisolibacter nicotianae TaxID=2364882 RepID=UPI001F0928BF|nr:hypothetical protein [Flavisolibacter nicotianae]